MRVDHASPQQQMRPMACQLLKPLQQSVVDQSRSEVPCKLLIVNGHLYAINNRALHVPGRDKLFRNRFRLLVIFWL